MQSVQDSWIISGVGYPAAVGVWVFVDDHRTTISRGGLEGAARRFVTRFVKEDTHDKGRHSVFVTS
jgi:hypothetical protein